MKNNSLNRRNFIQKSSLLSAGFSLGAVPEYKNSKTGNPSNEINGNEYKEDPASISFGIFQSDITPSPKILNWVTGRQYSAVEDPINVRVLALNDHSQQVLIISMELVYVGESITKLIKDKIQDKFGIPHNNILITATHNHSAPFSPVYFEELRRVERDLSWGSLDKLSHQEELPEYIQWKSDLITKTLYTASEAIRSLKPCKIHIGKSDISELVHNRRPRPVSIKYEKAKTPENFYYKHPDWDPLVISGNMDFGPVDRVMSVLFFEKTDSSGISTLFNLSAHPVSIYPYSDGLSGDWPGKTVRLFKDEFGGESFFVQGTTGDINPWKRGEKAVNVMANKLLNLAKRSFKHSAEILLQPLQCESAFVGLPLTEYGIERSGLKSMEVEVQVITLGSIAIVALPGEPMTDIGLAIKKASPFPHTLVLGYSNGVGTQYVGRPGEKAYGGYEVSEKRNLGLDNAGLILADLAKELLDKMYKPIEG
ncbi:hypothetical protein [Membranihabitans maritimus]|uniref:hypothetical protein n=1 Tax=Membranihabitans maritimus TaxID=2904244 RepID=UPI001F328B20|nr:hypothetical protein [Membranihabitans maritimus]